MNATRNTTCLLMALAVAASVAWATIPASAATGAAGIPLLGATAHVGTADFNERAIVCCGGLAGAGACVLKFGSDYRGAVVLSGNMSVETGGVSERQQADYILRALPVAAKHHVGRFLIYALRNSEKNPHDREDHFGIVHADFSPKPAFNALKNRNR